MRLERDLASDESAVRPSHRKLDFAIMVVHSVAVVLPLADRFVPLRDPAGAAPSPGTSIAVLLFEAAGVPCAHPASARAALTAMAPTTTSRRVMLFLMFGSDRKTRMVRVAVVRWMPDRSGQGVLSASARAGLSTRMVRMASGGTSFASSIGTMLLRMCP